MIERLSSCNASSTRNCHCSYEIYKQIMAAMYIYMPFECIQVRRDVYMILTSQASCGGDDQSLRAEYNLNKSSTGGGMIWFLEQSGVSRPISCVHHAWRRHDPAEQSLEQQDYSSRIGESSQLISAVRSIMRSSWLCIAPRHSCATVSKLASTVSSAAYRLLVNNPRRGRARSTSCHGCMPTALAAHPNESRRDSNLAIVSPELPCVSERNRLYGPDWRDFQAVSVVVNRFRLHDA